MSFTTFASHAILLACALTAPGLAGAQSYAPEYFVQFQAGTAMEMVSRLPGFVFDGGNPSRGSAGNVLINGKRPTSKTEPLGDLLGRIPKIGVERIDVINGGASGIDMQGFASVANLILKPMDLVSTSATASSSVMPDGSLEPSLEGSYSLKRGDKNLNLALGWRRSPDFSQGEGRRTTLYTAPTPIADVAIKGAGISDNKSLKLTYGQDVLDGQLTWNGGLAPWSYQSQIRNDGATPSLNFNNNTGRTLEQGLAYTRELAPGASMDLRALYRTADIATDSASGLDSSASHGRSTSTASEKVLAGELSWQALEGVVIRGGLERAVTANDNSNTSQANAQAIAVATGSAWVQESRVEGQLSSAWQVDSSLSAEAGVKIEHSSLSASASQTEGKAYVYPKPRLRVSLSPSPALQLRLRLEREISQINFGDAAAYFGIADKALRAGVPDVVAAKTWLCEGAMEYRFWERGLATLSYTQAHISDLIDRMPIRTANATYDVAGNVGEASADNITGMLNLPTDSWSLPQGQLKLSTTWRSSSVTDATTLAPRRLSGEQPMGWRVEFSQDLPQQRTAWGFSVDNGWSNDSWQVAERDTSSGSAWARAFVNYRPASNLMVTLELNNLASRVITYDRAHYAGGDRLAGGVDFVEHNSTRTQPFAMLRVRRDW